MYSVVWVPLGWSGGGWEQPFFLEGPKGVNLSGATVHPYYGGFPSVSDTFVLSSSFFSLPLRWMTSLT